MFLYSKIKKYPAALNLINLCRVRRKETLIHLMGKFSEIQLFLFCNQRAEKSLAEVVLV